MTADSITPARIAELLALAAQARTFVSSERSPTYHLALGVEALAAALAEAQNEMERIMDDYQRAAAEHGDCEAETARLRALCGEAALTAEHQPACRAWIAGPLGLTIVDPRDCDCRVSRLLAAASQTSSPSIPTET